MNQIATTVTAIEFVRIVFHIAHNGSAPRRRIGSYTCVYFGIGRVLQALVGNVGRWRAV